MEHTTGVLSGRGLEQPRVGVEGVTVSAEVDRRAVSVLVATGVGGLSEGTRVSVRGNCRGCHPDRDPCGL